MVHLRVVDVVLASTLCSAALTLPGWQGALNWCWCQDTTMDPGQLLSLVAAQ